MKNAPNELSRVDFKSPRAGLIFKAVIFAISVISAFQFGVWRVSKDLGVIYALITAGMLWLIFRSSKGKQLICSVIIALLLGTLVLTTVHKYVYIFVRQAEQKQFETKVLDDMARIRDSDPAFSNISVSFLYRKSTFVIISGSVPEYPDLIRFRERLTRESSSLRQPRSTRFDSYELVWDIVIEKTAMRLEGEDLSLFPVVTSKSR